MDMARLTELLAARLTELNVTEIPADPSPALLREQAYVQDFCGVAELDEELAAVCVELAAAAILSEQAALYAGSSGEGVTALRMGDVSVSYAEDELAGKRELADGICRRAIGILASRRGIRW